MPADGLTKVLPKQKSVEFIRQLGLVNITERLRGLRQADQDNLDGIYVHGLYSAVINNLQERLCQLGSVSRFGVSAVLLLQSRLTYGKGAMPIKGQCC